MSHIDFDTNYGYRKLVNLDFHWVLYSVESYGFI